MARPKFDIGSYSEEYISEVVRRFNHGQPLTAEDKNIVRFVQQTNPEAIHRVSGGTRRNPAGERIAAASAGGTGNASLNEWLQHQNYAGNKIVSPGGYKKSGRDFESANRRAGRINDEFTVEQMVHVDDKGNMTYGLGSNRQKISKSQFANILRRGSSGATLGQRDQMIYDAYMQNIRRQDEARRMAEARKAQAATDEREWQKKLREIEKRGEVSRANQLAIQKERESAKAESDRRREDAKIEAERRKAEAEQAKLDEFYERHGIDRGVKLSKKAMSDIDDGLKVWDYSPEAKKRIAQLNSEFEQWKTSSPYRDDPEARANYRRDIDNEIARFSKGLRTNPDSERFEEREWKRREYEDKKAAAAADKEYRRSEALRHERENRDKLRDDYAMKYVDRIRPDKETEEYKTFDEAEAYDEGVRRWNFAHGIRPDPQPDPGITDAEREYADGLYPGGVERMKRSYEEGGQVIDDPAEEATPPESTAPRTAPSSPSDWRTMRQTHGEMIGGRQPNPLIQQNPAEPAVPQAQNSPEDAQAPAPADPQQDQAQKAYCESCGAELDENGRCTNPDCPTNGGGLGQQGSFDAYNVQGEIDKGVA